jgi:hypothetical protein
VILATAAQVQRRRSPRERVDEPRERRLHQAQVPRRRDRRERDVGRSRARLLQREPRGARTAAQAEAVQHLGGQHEAHEAVGPRRLVVARDERPYPLLECVRGDTVDREQLRADKRAVPRRRDDEEPVAELVEVEREEVRHAPVRRVEREDPRVAVALAEQGREAHQLDEQLVGRKRRRADGQVVGGRLERRLGGRVERARVDLADALHQRADVVGRRGGGGVRALGRTGCDGQGRCENREQDPVHEAYFTNTKIRLPRLTS